MRSVVITAATVVLALGGCSQTHRSAAENSAVAAESQRPSNAESEAYMRKAEEDWAALAVRKVPGLMQRIIADDYVGVSSKGDVRDKAKQVALGEEEPSGKLVASKVDYVNYRHFGDTVIAQGAESLKRKDRRPDVRLIWTDVWMWRDGKWQIVASQDSVLPEKK